ncbi:hypothetical protein BGZ60DRAFT_430207 [Tricladium varicosporioides]|nr:hypothetical protein BGZ60DRAFT_430207 [Hymenoscyphus varicosporioides]
MAAHHYPVTQHGSHVTSLAFVSAPSGFSPPNLYPIFTQLPLVTPSLRCSPYPRGRRALPTLVVSRTCVGGSHQYASRQRPSPTTSVSSDDSDESESDLESCFDIGDEAGSSDSALTDYCSDVETFEEAEGLILDEDEDKDYPPEYYLNQEDGFDESEYLAEDYSDSSCLLLDYIEKQFN